MTAGQQYIVNYLEKSIEKKRISHAYLFEGGGPEKKKTALWFASLLCGQYDIKTVSLSENKHEISIDQIRELKRYLSLSPHSSLHKVAIIESAELMTPEAANAFLKTLEEPRGNAILILIANTISALPETILSRCEIIKFKNAPLDEICKNLIDKEHVAILDKPISDIFEYIEKISKDEEKVLNVLNSWLLWFREQMIKTKSKTEILKQVQKTKNLILNTNVNPRLALENLVLELK